MEKRLKDILEHEVDESFYLRQEQIERVIAHCERKQAEGCGFKTNFQDGGVSREPSKPRKVAGSMTPTSRILPPRFGNSRLNKMIDNGKIDTSKTEWVDAYNQSTSEEVSGTITTRVDASNHYLISEQTDEVKD